MVSWIETAVEIKKQVPAGRSTGINVPGQLWKSFHERSRLWMDWHTGGPEMRGRFCIFAGALAREERSSQVQKKKSAEDRFPLVKRSCLREAYLLCRIEAGDI